MRTKRTSRRYTSKSRDWSYEDTDASLAQGWGIFQCDDLERDVEIVNGKKYGPRRFELNAWADDPKGAFKYDNEAWVFVWDRAAKGDALAKRALRFLRRRSIKEYRDVESYCQTHTI
jgi:hypothetical protein